MRNTSDEPSPSNTIEMFNPRNIKMKEKWVFSDYANSPWEILLFQELEETSWRSKETPNEASWLKSGKSQLNI